MTISEQWRRPVVRHAALVLALLSFVGGSVGYMNHYAERMARQWLEGRYDPARGEPPQVNQVSFCGDQAHLDRILQQLSETRGRSAHYVRVMTYFYTRHYMAISVASLTGLIAAICLLFISKAGRASANRYTITIFIVMSSAAAYFAASPSIYRQGQNIADNKALHLRCEALENEILSYLVTGEDLQGQPREPREFIHHVDTRLAQANNIAVGFDDTKIPDYLSAYEGR